MPILGQSARHFWVQSASNLESSVTSGGRVVTMAWPGECIHPWDDAHQLVRMGSELEGVGQPSYVEPDLMQGFPHARLPASDLESITAPPCSYEPHDRNWPISLPIIGWHLDNEHSQLKAARERVGDSTDRRVRIAILDTGYDPDHVSLPRHLLTRLGRNFVEGDPPDDATDPGRHFPLNQPGHGTATLALLAGGRVEVPRAGFNDDLGGAPFAEILPVRIADSVIHFRTSAMAAGIDYGVSQGCDVMSISMGGVPTRQWAAAINRAYESGVVIVAAAGNRFGPLPPSTIVFPARFNRVIAVCGATAKQTAYYRSGIHARMHGCFGPPKKMKTALAAYTPNTPWAIMAGGQGIGFGGGTSSATPQVAAAAALWLQATVIPPGTEPWRRVEATRFALFSSARKNVPNREKFFGNGLLRAANALEVSFRGDLPMMEPDEVSFPWLRLLSVLENAPSEPAGEDLMFEVEALQLFLQSPEMEAIVGGADPHSDEITDVQRRRLIDAMKVSPASSKALRQRLTRLSGRLKTSSLGRPVRPISDSMMNVLGPRQEKSQLQLLRGFIAISEHREAGDLESLARDGRAAEGPLGRSTIRSVVERTETELTRIVREYLGDGQREHEIVKEIVRRGDFALRMIGVNDAGFKQRPGLLSDLEAIVRPDGSRPTFLIREGIVDQRSSPIGPWGAYLDTDSNDLEKAIACVGRVDDPSIRGGYGGTGVLVQENLILTNRHVLQLIARKQTDISWKLNPDTYIDFGHERRGWDTLNRRKLKRVVFIGNKEIDEYKADHAKLDLAAIELEPPSATERPRHVLSVDATVDWAESTPTIYTIGYPFKPTIGAYTPTLLERLFESHFGFKRLAPGEVIPSRRSPAAWTAAHDATTLGGNSGSAIVKAGRPFGVMGIHYGGNIKEPAENWGHILGLTLFTAGEGTREIEAGERLVDILDKFGVVINNRP